MKLSETKPAKNLTVLLIGYPGSGKSIAAASFPPPIYIFDLDKRIDSLLQYFPGRADIEFDYYGPNDFTKFDAMMDKMESGQLPYKTYILDSLTALARMAINYSISLRGGKGLKKGILNMIQVDDYGAETRVLSQALDSFRGERFNAHFVMTAHLVETATKKLDATDVIQQRLLTGGKGIAAEIPAYFNDIYYIYKEVNKITSPISISYKSTIIPTNGVDAKSVLPIPNTIDFTMTKPGDDGLFQKIQKACKEKGIDLS